VMLSKGDGKLTSLMLETLPSLLPVSTSHDGPSSATSLVKQNYNE
jgi:hypothetical protein